MAIYQQHDENYARLVASSVSPDRGEISRPVQTALLAEIFKAAAKKQYDRALALSRKPGGMDLDIVNARGVCLLRTGRYDEAVALYRNLVLQPGCTWMRKDRPLHYKTNFAVALLLSGRPSGCLDMLHELTAEAPPIGDVLRSAIKRWESTLPFWSWLNWKLCGAAPPDRPVCLDFEPGDFGCETVPALAGSDEDGKTPPRTAA
mgnify:CR=1 FL=1